MNEKDPSVLYPVLGPMRLEGAGALHVARSSMTQQRVWLRRVTASAMAQKAIDAAVALPRHSGLSAAVEAGTWQGELWIAGDFPDGQLLGDASDKAASDLAPIADALAQLHSTGLAHGLLSGEAVLLAADGRTLLYEVAMLELNRATDRRPEQTALSHLHRTAAFFSPERLKGAPPSPADDVYALAALVCLATGGVRPPRSSALEQLHAVMLGTWKPTPSASVSPAVRALLLKMLSADPALRPGMTEVAEGLRAVEYVVLAPAATAPGAPVFEVLPPPMPAPAPTVPTPVRRKTPPVPVQVGGAARIDTSFRARFSAFTISIAASDAKLMTAGLVAMAMIASTVALGAHVVSAREEAVTTAQVVKPVPRKEKKYNAEQLKQILRQKEEARRAY